MSQSAKAPDPQNFLLTALRRSMHALVSLIKGFLIPVSRDLWHVVCAICLPVTRGVTRLIATSLRNLHNKQHWMNRFSATFWGNAIGLAIAMMTAQMLSNFIEVRGAENLWGFFSERTLVSENSYKVMTFIAEFMVTLIVFSVVEYLLDLRARNKKEALLQDEET